MEWRTKYIIESNYFMVFIFCFEDTECIRPYGLGKYYFNLVQILVIQEWESILNNNIWVLYLAREG